MPLYSMRAQNLGVASVGAMIAVAFATSALAGPNPLTINLSVDGGAVAPIVDPGIPNGFVGNNRMEYTGSFATADYYIEWQIFGDANAGQAFGSFQGVGLSGDITIVNLSGVSHDFELSAEMLLAAALANSSYSGSLSLSMLSSNENGAGGPPPDLALSTLAGQSMYAASINGGVVQQFIADPTTYLVPAGAGDTDGPYNHGPAAGPGVISSLAHSFAFSLTGSTPGALDPDDYDYVTFSFTLNVVPAPGALALLGVAGLVGRRRRRCE